MKKVEENIKFAGYKNVYGSMVFNFKVSKEFINDFDIDDLEDDNDFKNEIFNYLKESIKSDDKIGEEIFNSTCSYDEETAMQYSDLSSFADKDDWYELTPKDKIKYVIDKESIINAYINNNYDGWNIEYNKRSNKVAASL